MHRRVPGRASDKGSINPETQRPMTIASAYAGRILRHCTAIHAVRFLRPCRTDRGISTMRRACHSRRSKCSTTPTDMAPQSQCFLPAPDSNRYCSAAKRLPLIWESPSKPLRSGKPAGVIVYRSLRSVGYANIVRLTSTRSSPAAQAG